MIEKLTQWWHQARWALYGALGICAVVIFFVLRNLTISKPGQTQGPVEVPRAIKDKMDQAREQSNLSRARSTVVAEEHKKALDDLQKIPDDQERRQKLADMLKTL